MKEIKHTPAPWFAVNYAGYINIQSDPYYGKKDLLDEDKCDQAIANGNLCGSAPELLEALQKIVDMNYQQAEDQYGDRDKAKSWSCVQVAEEAINKALGE